MNMEKKALYIVAGHLKCVILWRGTINTQIQALGFSRSNPKFLFLSNLKRLLYRTLLDVLQIFSGYG
uniref:Uncharacterized protein n=1 Tax=Nelumbo nucifera TaxID=4432 RepID=A0A822ZIH6_NELNU|nr:TPA_asm: hypothetical protein HUJ06_001399 [Nelumbo nucifera]